MRYSALTVEENRLLAETGPGTPCGRFFREYWQPVALLSDVSPGMPPKPTKIMGEDMVLFRGTDGKLGLIGRYCPHRGADMSFGRLEDGGLRCLYHGWLIDGTGRCLHQPGQPLGTDYAGQIASRAYPCVEAAGCVFAYMGDRSPPPFPTYDVFAAPAEHVFASVHVYDGNYVYDLEHNLDTPHVSFLHIQFLESELSGRFGKRPKVGVTGSDWSANRLYAHDCAPELETEERDYGLRITTIRNAGSNEKFVRGMEFFYPNAVTAPVVANGYTMQYHVPIDDHLHLRFDIELNRDTPFDKDVMEKRWANLHTSDGRLLRNRANGYLQDRSTMGDWYAGMGAFPPDHDAFVLESSWPIERRVEEQLGSQDAAIVKARALMLKAIERSEAGQAPPPAAGPGYHPVVAFSTVVPASSSWRSCWSEREKNLSEGAERLETTER